MSKLQLEKLTSLGLALKYDYRNHLFYYTCSMDEYLEYFGSRLHNQLRDSFIDEMLKYRSMESYGHVTVYIYKKELTNS